MKYKLKQFILIIIVVIITSILSISLIKSKKEPKKEELKVKPVLIRTTKVSKEDVSVEVSSYGTIQSATEITLSSEVSGKVIFISPSFYNGGEFKKDEIMFRIDSTNYESAVAEANARVAQATLNYEIKKADSEAAINEWKKINSSPQTPLSAKLPQLNEADAALKSAIAGLKMAKSNLEKTQIKAPFNCRIKVKQIDVGSFVSPGTPAAVIYSIDTFELKMPISSNEFSYLGIPFSYDYTINDIPPLSVTLTAETKGRVYNWNAKLTRTEKFITDTAHTINAIATINKSDDILPGIFVSAKISGITLKDVFVVPIEAMRENNFVLIVDENGRIHFRKVVVYRTEKTRAIISSGLKEGEVISITPLSLAVENMQVQLSDNK